MSCAPCLRAKQINTCAETLIIGTGATDTAYDVYIRQSSQHTDVFEVTSDGAGLISIDTTNYTFPEGVSFEIWAVLHDASITEREEITFVQNDATIPGLCVTFDSIAVVKAGCIFKAEENLISIVDEATEQRKPCICVTQAMWDAVQAGARPYKVYSALLYQDRQAQGLLQVGVTYRIDTYSAGDDFMNVGAASNVTGEIFIATGTTPNAWANGSTLSNDKPPQVTVLENTLGNIVWTNGGSGINTATLANAFAQLKTWYMVSSTDNVNQFMTWNDANSLTVITSIPTIQVAAPNEPIVFYGANGFLFYTPVEIRVYN